MGYTVCTTWLRLFLHEPNKNYDQSLNVSTYSVDCNRWKNRGNDFWLQLEKYGDLGLDETVCLLLRIQCTFSFSRYTRNMQGAWFTISPNERSPPILHMATCCKALGVGHWEPSLVPSILSVHLFLNYLYFLWVPTEHIYKFHFFLRHW